VGRAPLARPTDAPPAAHAALAGGSAATAPAAEDAADVPDEPAAPSHVAIIMDGNRRWARERGLSELEGHAAGVEKIRWLVEHSLRRGVRFLSLYAFSRENWARPDDEVAGLFRLLEQAIRAETPELVRQGVQVRLLGRLAELPDDLRRSIAEALEATAAGRRLTLAVAFNYAGRTEIVDAVRSVLADGLAPDQVDEDVIGGRLYTAGMPDPDLVIRTGGEQRLSNFLIWQSAYAEFWWSDTLWPAFDDEAYDAALDAFAGRSRRYGT
jgi:undecaprenyl diphosphate synthase